MKIFLIRHGEKNRGLGDVGLSSLGREQSSLIANYLKYIGVERLFSSKQKRAIETAEIIAYVLNKNFEVTDYLKERISFGEVHDQKYEDYIELCKHSTINRNYVLPNGETSVHAGKRIEMLIQSIPSSTKVVVFISHGGVIVDFLRNTFKESELTQKLANFLKYYMVQYGSITKIELVNNHFQLLSLGTVSHLTKSINTE